MRIVLVASTGGSVADRVLGVPAFRALVHSMVTDRPCAALDVAARHDLPTRMFDGLGRRAFSDALANHLDEADAEYVVLFFTRLLDGPLLDAYAHRIINLHGSVLPAFPGLDGFALTLGSEAMFAGMTIHFIDRQMDAGRYILQSAFPLDRAVSEERLRHQLFEQHCKGLVQVGAWLAQDRVEIVDGRVRVRDAAYGEGTFSPNLDDPNAIALRVPFNGDAAQI